MQSGTKNPPWARSNVNSNITGLNPQIMDPTMAMTQQGMMPFQQSQAVFNPNMMQAQGGMAMPMAGQMQMNQMAQGQIYPGNVVAYPTPRALNPGMYQNSPSNQSQNSTNEQRVFTGTVTKTHNDFGFVDHDVFYQTSVCAKGIVPKVNDRVLVEASFNPNMPFKWNATRVQVLPKAGPPQNKTTGGGAGSKQNAYNAVPPPLNSKKAMPSRRDDRPPRNRNDDRKRTRSRSRSRDRRDRSRRESPPRKRPVVHQPSPVKYVVRVPRMPLDISELDVPGLSQRYNNMYIPSDFFSAQVKWGEAFPPQNPFTLSNSCSYHIMCKAVVPPVTNDAVLEPSDADYRFSAKVMLISLPCLESFYSKCGLTQKEDKDKRSSKSNMHPTRLIKFLVGQRGKGAENFAVGGPWSPSLDGDNPETDPSVLVKTAIRTCKALTGIDLSACTQWYRVVEFYYWRDGGRPRLETVVLFLPDVWSTTVPRSDWQQTLDQYREAADTAVQRLTQPELPKQAAPQIETETKDGSLNDSTITIDETEDDDEVTEVVPEPTHFSKLDMKSIKVKDLRQELRARKVSDKGNRPQLLSRLSKLLKAEEVKEQSDEKEPAQEKQTDEPKETKPDDDVVEVKIAEENKEENVEKKGEPKSEKEIEEEKKKLEKEIHSIKTRYELPSTPHILVHPSTTAKSGKFNCSVASLSLLLDYRITDNKEHSFELFVFAEIFNEMLMRDFGFYIYKTLYTLPEKVDEKEAKSSEKKDDKAEKKDTKTDKKDEKSDKKEGEAEKSEKKDEKSDKKSDKDKKDDRRDDRRDSRKRDRKDSHSDDERSNSPKGRGVDLPPDPYLLLSLIYFDTSRCCYISKKDLHNLFMSLGLKLSRSQIKNTVDKVCVKENFNYKSLTQAIRDLSTGNAEALQDLPLDTNVTQVEVLPQIAELEANIATGNRNLLPVFNKPVSREKDGTTADVSETGLVSYKSRVIDIPATLSALTRSEQTRAKLEQALTEARQVARIMKAAAAQTQAASNSSRTQVQELQEQLAASKTKIVSLFASSKIFHTTLKMIQTKVEAVINIKFEDDDEENESKDGVNGPTKVEKTESNNDQSEEKKAKVDTEKTEKENVKDEEKEPTDVMEIDDKE